MIYFRNSCKILKLNVINGQLNFIFSIIIFLCYSCFWLCKVISIVYIYIDGLYLRHFVHPCVSLHWICVNMIIITITLSVITRCWLIFISPVLIRNYGIDNGVIGLGRQAGRQKQTVAGPSYRSSGSVLSLSKILQYLTDNKINTPIIPALHVLSA